MKNVPNILTLFRFFLVPVFLVVFFSELEHRYWVMILGGVMLYFRRSRTTIPANWYGKAVTCLVYATVLYLMFFPQTGLFEDWVATALIFLTVAGTVFSLIMYFICFTRVAKK